MSLQPTSALGKGSYLGDDTNTKALVVGLKYCHGQRFVSLHVAYAEHEPLEV